MTGETGLLGRLAILDTAAVSDAMDSLRIPGRLSGIIPRVPGAKACGFAYTVTYRPVDADGPRFRNAANYLDNVPEDSLIVVDNGGSTSCTTWGSLMTTVARMRGIRGTVVYGSARDVVEVRSAGYPLYSTGVTMVSGKNRVQLDTVGGDIDIHGVTVRSGDIIVADDSGVLSVPQSHAEEIVVRAESVELTERNIAAAVTDGWRLDEARKAFGYATPWKAAADSEAKDA